MTVERSETLVPGPAQALAGLLGAPGPEDGPLPALWHWVYLLDRPQQSDLGPDGHPVRHAVPAPPGPGLRRMFAGGRITAVAPLRLGEAAARCTRVTSTVTKTGRSGPLTFVTVTHEYTQAGSAAVIDEQDLVYRQSAAGGPANDPGPPPDLAPMHAGEHEFRIDPTVLFRFSALTYNAHRIHYDREYATREEGYPGLVVHGPLQALLMAGQARAPGAPYRFEYRLESPLFDHQGCVAAAAPEPAGGVPAAVRAYVRDGSGRRTASGRFIPGG